MKTFYFVGVAAAVYWFFLRKKSTLDKVAVPDGGVLAGYQAGYQAPPLSGFSNVPGNTGIVAVPVIYP